jgi:non-specific serine/threonine protein kinase
MIGKSILHYTISEKLGEGGMGVVYLAEDTKLKRLVAIKFLPSHITADSAERRRFELEAQAAAALNHPNIAHIYAIEESDDEIFIVMEYIKGQELSDLIHSQSTQDLATLIDYAGQIASGLAAAHKKDIVHRDIKSSNIMITDDGQVKIMDFGLAKVRGTAQLTKEHTTLGTAAYMSPEQARGDEVDKRTDIWSFGVVFYEMLTGNLPFKGDYDQAVIYAILNEEPNLVLEKQPQFKDLISRCLQKDTTPRYQAFDQVLNDLTNLTAKTAIQKLDSVDPEHPKRKLNPVLLGTIVTALLIAVAFVYYFLTANETDSAVAIADSPSLQKSIIVLPFSNISQNPDDEYFSDGITEELIDALSKVEKLRVVSRTSAFAVKGKQQDIRSIGEQFNVTHALEGSVRKAGSRVRINAQLVSVSNGYQLWSEKYDRQLADIFDLQDEIAGNIVNELQLILTDREKNNLKKLPTRNIEAYDYYLKGKQYINQGTKASITTYALEMFNQAIKIDPDYALAYTGLAETWTWIYLWYARTDSVLKNAELASLKALDIDPDLAEAHVSYGYLMSLNNNYDQARQAFEKAIELNPSLFDAYYLYARASFTAGNNQKFAQMIFKAYELQPENYLAHIFLDDAYRKLGMFEKAKESSEKSLVVFENHLRLKPDDIRARMLGAVNLVKMGYTERAVEWVDQVLKIDSESPNSLYNGACVFALAGETDRAIDCLEKQFNNNALSRSWVENDSDLNSLRDHPRFIELISKLK